MIKNKFENVTKHKKLKIWKLKFKGFVTLK